MGQGLQRSVQPKDGRVLPLTSPSPSLVQALTPQVTSFLSDVETEAWRNGTIESLAQRCKEFVVTRGAAGADVYRSNGEREHHAPFDVEAVVDTNGAGDSFAMAYMYGMSSGHSSPGAIANWAGAQAVSKEQGCKPSCIKEAIQENLAGMPPSNSIPNTLLYRFSDSFSFIDTLFSLRKVLSHH